MKINELRGLPKEEIKEYLTNNPKIKELANIMADAFRNIEPISINSIKKILAYFEEMGLLLNKLNEYKEIADNKTKKKIKDIFNSEICSIEELKELIKEIENRIDYTMLYENNVSNNIVTNLTCLEDNIYIDELTQLGTVVIKTNNEEIKFTVTNFEAYKKRMSYTTSLLFLFIIENININTDKSRFTANEFLKARGISIDQRNRNKVKFDIEILSAITNIVHKNKKEDLFISENIFTSRYEKGNITIKFNENFAKSLKKTYAIIDKNIYKLNGKPAILGYYFQVQFRITKKQYIRKTTTLMNLLNMPSYEEVRNKNRLYRQLIIDPFNEYILTVKETLKDLSISFDFDINNCTIEEFIKGNVYISHSNELIIKRYEKIDLNSKKKSKKYNTDKKQSNISLCNKYIKEGKTDKEISVLLKKDMRTIRRYKMDIAKRTQY